MGDETTSGEPRTGRIHQGRTVAERRAQRRAALLDTALELFGTKGYAATSIEELCRASFVSTRYFYEEFNNREDVLATLYGRLLANAWDGVVSASADPGPDFLRRDVRARVAAFVHALLDDPRAARVVCLEAVGVSPGLEASRRTMNRSYAHALIDFFGQYVPMDPRYQRDYEIVAIGMVGAINEVILDWIDQDEPATLDELIQVVCEIFLVLGTSQWGKKIFDEYADNVQAAGTSVPGSSTGPAE